MMDVFISEFVSATWSLMTMERLEALTLELYKTVKDVVQSFLVVLRDTIELGSRPSQIPMPKASGSIITPIQAHVISTRFGHGSQKKKWKLVGGIEAHDA